ncbi:helix-turn-helix domain-containing protein [Curtobacterium flaccumfaciens]|uniref:helix-turn-helix domain-containing protein n=1 Tax=Curtobacterium flaccumfaciens TaxID=2035 RepID=UPI003434DF80
MVSFAQLLDVSSHSAPQRRATELARSDYKLLSDLVRQRKAAGLTQQDVANRMGITQPSVANLERHDADPKLSTIRRYAHAIEALIWHAVEPDEGQLNQSDRWQVFTIPVGTSSGLSVRNEQRTFSTPGPRQIDVALAA